MTSYDKDSIADRYTSRTLTRLPRFTPYASMSAWALGIFRVFGNPAVSFKSTPLPTLTLERERFHATQELKIGLKVGMQAAMMPMLFSKLLLLYWWLHIRV